MVLHKVSCPIGVLGIIFEARPDALIQISTLCLKSGNCCILKGGSETKRTNKVLFDIIYKAACDAGLPAGDTAGRPAERPAVGRHGRESADDPAGAADDVAVHGHTKAFRPAS